MLVVGVQRLFPKRHQVRFGLTAGFCKEIALFDFGIQQVSRLVTEFKVKLIRIEIAVRFGDRGALRQMAHTRVNKVEDVVAVGDEVMVRVVEVDKQGRINLSIKDATPEPGKQGAQGDVNIHL